MMTDHEMVQAMKLIRAPRLTMSMLADECGVSRGLLYYYCDGHAFTDDIRQRLQTAFANVKARGYHIPRVTV